MTKKIDNYAISLIIFLAIFLAAGCMDKSTRNSSTAEIILPDKNKIIAEVVSTPKERAKGLMFREFLEERHGMLFVFENESVQEFWMKNTFIDLDIIYLDKDFKITEIFHSVPKSKLGDTDEKISRVRGVGKYVLEISAGTAERFHLKSGDKLTINFL